MRIFIAFALLLLLGAAAAWLLKPGAEERGPLVARAQDAIDRAGDASVEQVADAWLGGSDDAERQSESRNALALALAIRVGRFEALRGGAQPVPAALKRRFKGHYDAAVLAEARWTIARPGSRLGRVLARWPVKEGAVTLGDAIVFKTKSASRNHKLFAHELVHVEQYRELGVSEFARRYAADPEPLEDEAEAKARRVIRKT